MAMLDEIGTMAEHSGTTDHREWHGEVGTWLRPGEVIVHLTAERQQRIRHLEECHDAYQAVIDAVEMPHKCKGGTVCPDDHVSVPITWYMNLMEAAYALKARCEP